MFEDCSWGCDERPWHVHALVIQCSCGVLKQDMKQLCGSSERKTSQTDRLWVYQLQAMSHFGWNTPSCEACSFL